MFGKRIPVVGAQASRLASKPIRPAGRTIIGSAGLVLTKLKRKVNNNN